MIESHQMIETFVAFYSVLCRMSAVKLSTFFWLSSDAAAQPMPTSAAGGKTKLATASKIVNSDVLLILLWSHLLTI